MMNGKFRVAVVSISVIMFVSAILVGISGVEATGGDIPTNIHLTWNQNDTAHTMVVTWQTDNLWSDAKVYYDTVPRDGVPSSYSFSVTATSHTYPSAGGYIYDAQLTGLSPDTVYYFICGGGGGYCEERSFRTAPEASKPFTFVAGSDCRSGAADWPEGRDAVSRTMARFNPSFVLFPGDFVKSANDQDEWDSLLASMQDLWVDNNGLTIPIIPAIGNHEGNGVAYYGQFALPENERWYSLDWGSDLHIVVLSTQDPIGGAQLDWLENDLAEHESATWKVVIFHEPPYTASAGHPSRLDIRETWCPVFDNYHVDLVFCGHCHVYERTHPIYNGTVKSDPSEGTIYVTTGGWGAPLHDAGSDWWTAYSESTYNFVAVEVEDTRLRCQAVDWQGEVIDSFEIRKPQENFTIVVLPDTQLYSRTWPEIFDCQTEWIVNNVSEWNIAFVTHEGDIVDDGKSDLQWQHAQHSMRILDNKVPYGFCCGNHDTTVGGSSGEADLMAQYFPSGYYESFDYWGGSYWDDKNNYQLISACGVDLLMLHVEYNPMENVLDWASSVLDNYPDRYVILTTHSFLEPDGSRTPPGEKIWDRLVLPHHNIQLVLCGHRLGQGSRRSDSTPDGRTVHQIFANYQNWTNGGNGFLRLMTFVPGRNEVYVRTYSPWLDEYLTDSASNFVLSTPLLKEDTIPPAPFDLLTPENGATVTIGKVTLEWGESSDAETGLSHYEVWLDGSNVDNVMACEYTTTELSEGSYEWQVIAVDGVGNKTESEIFVFEVVETAVEFEFSDLSLSKTEVEPGESTDISIVVKNVSDVEVTRTVELRVDGEVVDSEEVTLSPDESKTVSFTVSSNEPGTHSVEVDGLTGSFEVAAPEGGEISLWPIVAVIAIIVAVGGGVLWHRRRR